MHRLRTNADCFFDAYTNQREAPRMHSTLLSTLQLPNGQQAHAASAAVVSTEQKTSAEQQHPVTSALEPAFASPPIGGRMQAQVKDLVSEIMCLCEKPDGWVKIARDGGITLYNRPSSEMPCFKGEGVLKFPLALIINFLQDRSLQHQWDDLYDVHRDVEICGAQTKIEYFRCKAVGRVHCIDGEIALLGREDFVRLTHRVCCV